MGSYTIGDVKGKHVGGQKNAHSGLGARRDDDGHDDDGHHDNCGDHNDDDDDRCTDQLDVKDIEWRERQVYGKPWRPLSSVGLSTRDDDIDRDNDDDDDDDDDDGNSTIPIIMIDCPACGHRYR